MDNDKNRGDTVKKSEINHIRMPDGMYKSRIIFGSATKVGD
jgi:hypothetical protein